MRKHNNESEVNYINVVDSTEWTIIENWGGLCATVRHSNFFRNVLSEFLLASFQKVIGCIFIGNSDKPKEGNIEFIDCIGTFFGNPNNLTDAASYAFPSYRLFETKAIKRNLMHRLTALFLAPSLNF